MIPSKLQNQKHLHKVKYHFDLMSKDRDRWIKRAEYFHSEDLRVIKEIIPVESSVLETGNVYHYGFLQGETNGNFYDTLRDNNFSSIYVTYSNNGTNLLLFKF